MISEWLVGWLVGFQDVFCFDWPTKEGRSWTRRLFVERLGGGGVRRGRRARGVREEDLVADAEARGAGGEAPARGRALRARPAEPVLLLGGALRRAGCAGAGGGGLGGARARAGGARGARGQRQWV